MEFKLILVRYGQIKSKILKKGERKKLILLQSVPKRKMAETETHPNHDEI